VGVGVGVEVAVLGAVGVFVAVPVGVAVGGVVVAVGVGVVVGVEVKVGVGVQVEVEVGVQVGLPAGWAASMAGGPAILSTGTAGLSAAAWATATWPGGKIGLIFSAESERRARLQPLTETATITNTQLIRIVLRIKAPYIPL
jgi:hypothetical protein